MSETFNLHQALQLSQWQSCVQIGKMPPTARLIEEAPSFIVPFLRRCTSPRTRDELVLMAQEESGLGSADSLILVDELIEAQILTSTWIDLSERYSRHDLYYDLAIGSSARTKVLKSATVAIVGVGGIGTNVAMQLAGAGVGRLILADGDIVEESNLTRQFLFTEGDIGQYKVMAAENALVSRNADLSVSNSCRAISSRDDVCAIFAHADVAVVSADTPAAILEWSNHAAYVTQTPFSSAGYQDAVGLVGPLIVPGRTGCMNCFQRSADVGNDSRVFYGMNNLNAAYQAPSFGPLNAIVAGMQAMEIIKFLLGGTVDTVDRRIAFDSVAMEMDSHQYGPDPSCDVCGAVKSTYSAGENSTNDGDLVRKS